MRVVWLSACALVASACTLQMQDEEASEILDVGEMGAALANNQLQPNTLGALASFSTAGSIAQSGPFFESLGSNDRRCVDCHQPDQGFSITPSRLALSFARSAGLDPVFRAVDGSVSPSADVSTLAARRQAYELLLGRGLIRVEIAIPPNAEFELIAVDDPAGYADATRLSLFRRPLPATNLRFNAAVMWDGRESPAGLSLDAALLNQARGATLGHAQAVSSPGASQLRAIVDFEAAISTAQIRDVVAGSLFDEPNGVRGGPAPLAAQPFYLGINDPFGREPGGRPFDPKVFSVFDGFEAASGETPAAAARASIARGQRLFNTRTFILRNVGGINDDPALGSPRTLTATCGTCHNAPNVGSASLPLFTNIGVGGERARIPQLPLYTLRDKVSGAVKQTTDPGRGLITGKWRDVQSFKTPGLRGLAARAPYFHNGQAVTLQDVVEFYDSRFAMGLSAAERGDLVAFMQAL
jgi:cytochrome c peroxidase